MREIFSEPFPTPCSSNENLPQSAVAFTPEAEGGVTSPPHDSATYESHSVGLTSGLHAA